MFRLTSPLLRIDPVTDSHKVIVELLAELGMGWEWAGSELGGGGGVDHGLVNSDGGDQLDRCG